jgi:hypothetical protein
MTLWNLQPSTQPFPNYPSTHPAHSQRSLTDKLVPVPHPISRQWRPPYIHLQLGYSVLCCNTRQGLGKRKHRYREAQRTARHMHRRLRDELSRTMATAGLVHVQRTMSSEISPTVFDASSPYVHGRQGTWAEGRYRWQCMGTAGGEKHFTNPSPRWCSSALDTD